MVYFAIAGHNVCSDAQVLLWHFVNRLATSEALVSARNPGPTVGVSWSAGHWHVCQNTNCTFSSIYARF